MKIVRVYVAAPYEDSEAVRSIHKLLRELGLEPSSAWAEEATGAEDFTKLRPWELLSLARQNDEGVRSSDAMLVMARKGAGGEMFAEARYATDLGLPIFWIGRLTLSAWRPNVTRCESLTAALDALARYSR